MTWPSEPALRTRGPRQGQAGGSYVLPPATISIHFFRGPLGGLSIVTSPRRFPR